MEVKEARELRANLGVSKQEVLCHGDRCQRVQSLKVIGWI